MIMSVILLFFPLVETCTSTWAPHSKLQSTRLSLCDSRDTRWKHGSFMHSLNSLRWKSEIAEIIHSPQERSTNVWPSRALSHFLWSLLILQVNKVVQKKKLPAIVSSIKVRTRTRSGLCGDFEGAIYVDLAEQTGLLYLPCESCNHGGVMGLMRYLRM